MSNYHFWLAILIFINISKTFSQEKHINFILIVDEVDFAKTKFFSDACFLVKDSNKRVVDTLFFEYKTGELILSSGVYEKLFSFPLGNEVDFCIRYTKMCKNLEKISFDYKIPLKIGWLKQPYIMLKVYNFSNKIHWKNFYEREGYGIDIKMPAVTILIARKRFKGDKGCD